MLTPDDIALKQRIKTRLATAYPVMPAGELERFALHLLTHNAFAVDKLGRMRTTNPEAIKDLGVHLALEPNDAEKRENSKLLTNALAGDVSFGAGPISNVWEDE